MNADDGDLSNVPHLSVKTVSGFSPREHLWLLRIGQPRAGVRE
jgi:hypothetical protein